MCRNLGKKRLHFCEKPPKELTDRLKEVSQEGPHQYPITMGAPNFRRAVSRKCGRFMGIPIDPDTDIVVTIGSTEAMVDTIFAHEALMRVIRRMTESVKCSFLLLSSCMVLLLPFSFVRVGRACVLPARALFIIAKL